LTEKEGELEKFHRRGNENKTEERAEGMVDLLAGGERKKRTSSEANRNQHVTGGRSLADALTMGGKHVAKKIARGGWWLLRGRKGKRGKGSQSFNSNAMKKNVPAGTGTIVSIQGD